MDKLGARKSEIKKIFPSLHINFFPSLEFTLSASPSIYLNFQNRWLNHYPCEKIYIAYSVWEQFERKDTTFFLKKLRNEFAIFFSKNFKTKTFKKLRNFCELPKYYSLFLMYMQCKFIGDPVIRKRLTNSWFSVYLTFSCFNIHTAHSRSPSAINTRKPDLCGVEFSFNSAGALLSKFRRDLLYLKINNFF
jgi:hypothetical protein